MNKKNWIALVLGLTLIFTFAGCSNTDTTTRQNEDSSALSQSQVDMQEMDGKQITSDLPNQNTDFNFESKTVLLNSGYEMPIVGLGTWTLDDETAENSVYHALKDGYRLIDTARYYGNAQGVGDGVRRAIAEGIVNREDVFITTKIVPYGFDDYDAAIDECIEALGLDYIDLLLIHQQGTDEKELYAAIERAVDNGKVHSLGMSNYYTQEDFERITENAKIMPAVIQNENHIFFQNTEFQSYVKQFGVVIESYYPFGGRGHTSDSMNNEVIAEIAEAHEKTGAQIILRWHLQAGYIAIPGSSNPDHIAENYNIFDFELSDEEMQKIADLDTGERYETW